MIEMIKPHGGTLVERHQKKELPNISEFQTYTIDSNLVDDIVNIATGVYSPLTGFLRESDLDAVLTSKRLEDGTPWTIPILYDVDSSETKTIKEHDQIILYNKKCGLTALLEIQDIYKNNKKRLAQITYGTSDIQHPGVNNVLHMKDYLVGGEITLIKKKPQEFQQYDHTPKETRSVFKKRGWKKIIAFQTRNPPHLGHEYLQKTALTFADGLFINPIIGKKKIGDFRDNVILASYETLIQNYFIPDRTMLSILRTSMKYAGPREAIHHAIMRQNYGCTHFIVGRDHAGVGNYYLPYASHDIFQEFPDLKITPLFFRSFYQCKKCGSMVNDKICPHEEKYHIYISGKKIRQYLLDKKSPPENIMRKEVFETILKFNEPFVT